MHRPSASHLSIALLPLLLLGPLTSGTCRADEYFIEMCSSAFLPQSGTVQAGDTVTWVHVAGSHVVRSGVPGGAPGTADEPGALFEGPVDAQNPTFSHTFSGPPATIAFHDGANPSQVGTIELLGDDLTFVVTVLDNAYEPPLVELFEGDSIRWEHEPGEMLHTVTSGLSSAPADNPGALFDAVSSDGFPVFIYTFDVAGEVPYFCLPHECCGMLGMVVVQRRFLRGDANEDGVVEIADPIALLGVLFQGAAPSPCLDASDANDDGSVNIADAIHLLSYLFSQGAMPPAPFPAPGPDRTEDPLRCLP
ncbi:MAG: plastocyanin/azurin family copper-binding protein [Planctomycetota bacterium]